MITFTVADLIHEPAVSVLQDNSLWSVFMAQVVDVAEWELKERPESARLVRPISFCLAQEFGPAHYSVGRIASTAKFVNEKRVYDLWQSSPEAARQAAAQMHIRSREIAPILENQQLCQEGSNAVFKWRCHTAEFLDFLEQSLCGIVESERERWIIKKAMVRGLSSTAGCGGGVYIASCNNLRARLVGLLVGEHLKTSTARNTARHFGISIQHVYRLADEAKAREKEVT